MQLLVLPLGWTILLDSAAWAILQPAIAYLCTRLPAAALDPGRWLFRTRPWEEGGAIYERLGRVKRWKSRLPSGGTVFAGGFSMKRITSRRREDLERWAQETCRAELTHWIALLAAGLFFLWNPPLLGVAMVLYAVALNGPCIVVQRYNRPHLVRMLRRQGGGPAAPAAANLAEADPWTAEEAAFRDILAGQVGRRPQLAVQDLYKLIHQAAAGSEHAVQDPEAARAQLAAELRELAAGPAEPTVERLSADGEIVRVNLRPYCAGGGDIAHLAEAFVATARHYRREAARLRRYWGYAERMSRTGALPFAERELADFFAAMERAGFPPVHHSEAYRAAYRPAYRVVARAFFDPRGPE